MTARAAILGMVCAFLVGATLGPWGDPPSAQTTIRVDDKNSSTVKIDKGESETPSMGSGATTSKKKERAAPKGATRQREIDPEDRFEPGELVVLNPPKGFESFARQIGVVVIEDVPLDSLALNVKRLHVPARLTERRAIQLLSQQFPGLEIDVNHIFDPSAGRAPPKSYAQAMIGWRNVPSSCGRGIRVGVIDGVVDLKHPALKGRSIVYRSFHYRQRAPGFADHGTAIAAMMIGQPAHKS